MAHTAAVVALGQFVESKSKHVPKFLELNMTQVLSEQVCQIVFCTDVEKHNLLFFNQFPDVMIAYVNMFQLPFVVERGLAHTGTSG